MKRSLYAPRPIPYYIFAPPYRTSSAGIRVMHMLCDALNRSGQEAYVATAVVNPALMTPCLTGDVRALHKSHNIEPIVVYPEVVHGNPLKARIVVRYLLNAPGFIGGDEEYAADEVLFAFTKGLLLPGMSEDNVLFLQPVDLSIFKPHENPAKRQSGKVCYYQGRKGRGVDKSLLPSDAIEITGSYPATWPELAEIFQTCEFFYSSSTSALSAEAAVCGCIGVVIPGESAPQNFSLEENGNYGVAWGLAPEEIQRARTTLPLLRANLEKHAEEFWPALDHFVNVTQLAAGAQQGKAGGCATREWLSTRVLSDAQKRFTAHYLEQNTTPKLGVVIIDPAASRDKVNATVASLTHPDELQFSLLPLVLTTADAAYQGIPSFGYSGGNVAGAINELIAGQECDWFVIVQAGETFIPSGLLIAALELMAASGWRAAQTDEAMRLEGDALELLLRPDVNLDLLLSFPASLARHWLFHRETWIRMGSFATACPESFELEYILRLLETSGFQGLGHISEPLIIADILSLHDSSEERQVIERHLYSRGFINAQVNSRVPARYEIDYAHQDSPRVSIIILVSGHLSLAQRCVESLLENTTYVHYELLLVDQGNSDSLVCDWLSGIEQLNVPHIRVLRYPADASRPAIRNHAATECSGEFLLFLDAGIGIVGKDWLQQLLNHGMRPEVGGVGAKLISASGEIVHAGFTLGFAGPVGEPCKGLRANGAGYMQRLEVDQNIGALTGKCLLVRQELFCAVGGFDEALDPWDDVDLCLKLSEAGYVNVWTPRVRLLASETTTVQATPEQEDRMYARWLPVLARDPSYNRNFSLAADSAFERDNSAISWQPTYSFRPVPVILAHPVSRLASGFTRIVQPFNALREAAVIDGVISSELLSVEDLERYDPDVILLQRQLNDVQFQAMRRMKAFSRAFRIYDLDEYLPDLTYHGQPNRDVLQHLGRALMQMDRLVVSSEMLASVFEGFCSDTRIIASLLDPLSWAGLTSKRRCSDKPRVGWVGEAGRPGDLIMIENVLKEFIGEVEWVFVGTCPNHLRFMAHEFHKPQNPQSYPALLASLNLDLVLAPLEDNLLNRCKSNLPLLEFGACGLAVICSDLEPYRADLPVTRVKNTFDAWVTAIRDHLADLDASAALGDALRNCVRRDWMLEGTDVLEARRKIWLPDS